MKRAIWAGLLLKRRQWEVREGVQKQVKMNIKVK
jgi:hypothetical protein